jgi:hypothetical protein
LRRGGESRCGRPTAKAGDAPSPKSIKVGRLSCAKPGKWRTDPTHWATTTANGLGSYTLKGTATRVTDVAKNEIRITASVSDLAAVGKAKPGNRLTALHASTTAILGVLVADVDTADGSKSYVAPGA